MYLQGRISLKEQVRRGRRGGIRPVHRGKRKEFGPPAEGGGGSRASALGGWRASGLLAVQAADSAAPALRAWHICGGASSSEELLASRGSPPGGGGGVRCSFSSLSGSRLREAERRAVGRGCRVGGESAGFSSSVLGAAARSSVGGGGDGGAAAAAAAAARSKSSRSCFATLQPCAEQLPSDCCVPKIWRCSADSSAGCWRDRL